MSAVGRTSTAVPVSRRKARKSRALDLAIGVTLARAAMFGAVCVITYFASSLSGAVMMEQARKEGAQVRTRLSEAKALANQERRRVDTLTDSGALDQWALAQGFERTLIVPAAGPKEATVVAQVGR